ncbi:MAG: hypothetical protein HY817_01325, partial [Candidatus Abawacabacteria bacterium]|nr:hypothetical protein [Candidatus Abawacabacteria bacterium]
MIKQILTLLLFLLLFFTSVQAQQESNPLIYQTFIRDGPSNADQGGYISIVDALTFKELSQVELFPSAPQRIELTKDKRRAFVNNNPFVDDKKGMTVVDLEQRRVIGRLFDNIGVYGVKLSPTGMMWALLDEPKEISIIDPETLRVMGRIAFSESPRDLIFSPDGRRAYVSLFSKDVFILDVLSGSRIAAIQDLPERSKFQVRPQELELSPDGQLLFVGSNDTVSIFETRLFKLVNRFKSPSTSAFGDLLLKTSLDGKFLYVTGYLGFGFSIYNVNAKEIVKTISSFVFEGDSKGFAKKLEISSDGQLLYLCQDYGVLLFDTTVNKFLSNPLTSTSSNFPSPFSGGIALTGDFSIGQPPTLQTTAPATNQQVMAGQATTIKWQTTVAGQSYAIASHMVEISTDSGATFAPIPGAERLPAQAQEFIWQVPDVELMNRVQIRVSTVDLGARRANSTTGNFSIVKGNGQTGDTQAPMVSFLSPKGGERFTSGDSLQISWMSSDNVAVTSQDLSLSTDGGTTFPITLANGLAGTTQSFSFPIPMTLQSEQTRLRLIVRDEAGNMAQTVTPSNFRIELGADTIAPLVTISQPTANQSLIAGQPIQVRWQSSDNRAVVSQALLLSLDGGQTFTTISSFG